ncbi:alpha/beta hydrolase [Streptomyces xiaopingdaonensis]|uniref:alpha/beta hydrolase n=1 Tax=Streptomyces xiaopingdaonensis TaxID=1565415 RepID=UPI0002F85960|nr:alpha/beta hydrolase [Streptomyces xiaopingdaonensis]
MFDEETAAAVRQLDASFPAVHRMTGAEARAAIAARRAPVENLGDVARTEDRTVPGPEGPLPVRLYFPSPPEAPPRPVIVFFHGGGFVFCDIDSHDGFCREMAKGTDSVVVSVGYRLAPEHPAPAAALDASAAVAWAAEEAAAFGGDAGRLLVAGDSAGGNLAAVAALAARDTGQDLAGQILVYPVIDPACDTESYTARGSGYGNTRAAMDWYWRQYLPGGRLPEPVEQVAPLRAASLRGLPPAVVVTAGLDPLCDEGRAYGRALADSGVPAVRRHYPELFHGFLTVAGLRPAQSARAVLWHDVRNLTATASRGAAE